MLRSCSLWEVTQFLRPTSRQSRLFPKNTLSLIRTLAPPAPQMNFFSFSLKPTVPLYCPPPRFSYPSPPMLHLALCVTAWVVHSFYLHISRLPCARTISVRCQTIVGFLPIYFSFFQKIRSLFSIGFSPNTRFSSTIAFPRVKKFFFLLCLWVPHFFFTKPHARLLNARFRPKNSALHQFQFFFSLFVFFSQQPSTLHLPTPHSAHIQYRSFRAPF